MGADKQTGENAIGKGKAGPGRPAGIPNRTTALLKDAILLAADDVGEDGQGKDGLQGYLRSIAATDKRAYATLLGKVLPLHVAHSGSVERKVEDMTDDELIERIRAIDYEIERKDPGTLARIRDGQPDYQHLGASLGGEDD